MARQKKTRVPIPSELSALVLFSSDRACCVCHEKGSPIQIHHIDDDPSRNEFQNLAVLCLDCHNLTQIKGGFGRKLDADQVRLYRDHWVSLVAETRKSRKVDFKEAGDRQVGVELATTLTEINLEKEDYSQLAVLYKTYGNSMLRDKYVEKAIEEGVSDDSHCYLRAHIQGRPDLIPPDVVERVTQMLSSGPSASKTELARHFGDVGRSVASLQAYLEGISEDLESGNLFAAMFYLKEVVECDFPSVILPMALKEFRELGDLWWEVRTLQELGWDDELKEVVQGRRREIEQGGNPFLLRVLYEVDGNIDEYMGISAEIERSRVTVVNEETGYTYHVFRDDPDGDESGSSE